jgi:hypothetical protein
MPGSTPFGAPIILPDGKRLVTLRDAIRPSNGQNSLGWSAGT